MKKKDTTENEADRWFRHHAEAFLRRVGVSKCLRVADIGCNNGRFTLSAARIVGSCGTVYAIDSDKDVLQDVTKSMRYENQHNIIVINADFSGESLLDVPKRTVDIVLLYDVLHRGYMPEKTERGNMLRHIYHILKPGGVLSCFPTHLKKYGVTLRQLQGEIGNAGFVLNAVACRRLVHDGNLVRGRVLSFSKIRTGAN